VLVIGAVTTDQAPLVVGSTYTFQASPFADGQWWDLTGATVNCLLQPPAGPLQTIAATITNGSPATAATVLAGPIGNWSRQWQVTQGGKTYYSNVIAFPVGVPPSGPPGPTINSVSPATDWISGGTYFVVTGSGFAGVSSATFGTSAAQWLFVKSNTEVHVSDFPAPTAGTVNLVLTAGGNPSTGWAVTRRSAVIAGTVQATRTFTGSTGLSGACLGNDNLVWVGAQYGSVWKVDTSGVSTGYALDSNNAIHGVAAGPGGRIWTAGYDIVGDNTWTWRLNTDGTAAVRFQLVSPDPVNFGTAVNTTLCVGPDGRLYYPGIVIGSGGRHVVLWAVDDAGNVTPYDLGNLGTLAITSGICVGSDGNLWFAAGPFNATGWSLYKVSTAGVVLAIYSVPTVTGISFLCAGPDGNIWFVTNGGTAYVGRCTPSGTVNIYAYGGGGALAGHQICAGPDGNVYWVDTNGHLFQATTSGTVTDLGAISTPSGSNNAPFGLAVGADGKLYASCYTSSGDGSVKVVV
jgi:hypothetical protein